jgi:hypothetical protein
VKDHKQTFWLEPNKKTSFLFESCAESADRSKIQKPCNLIVECCQSTSSHTCFINWLFGGLEVHSNSRNIEVYAVPEGKDFNGREYWQTHRGSKIEDTDNSTEKDECEKEIYQTIILPPSSKPTSIKSLHLKLLSLRPSKCTIAFVKSIKLKGRIPEATPDSSETVSGSNNSVDALEDQPATAARSITNKESNDGSTALVANAISGLTMSIDNARGSMEASIQSSIGEIQSLAFNQNQSFTGKLTLLENSVNELKDCVDSLKTNVELLRKENVLQNEERHLKMEELNEKHEKIDKEYLHKLLLEERQWIATEMQKQKNEMISQVVDQLVCRLNRNVEKDESEKGDDGNLKVECNDEIDSGICDDDDDDDNDLTACAVSTEKCDEEPPFDSDVVNGISETSSVSE